MLNGDGDAQSKTLGALKKGHVRRVSCTLAPLEAKPQNDALVSILDALDADSVRELRLMGLTHVEEAPPQLLEAYALTHLSLHGLGALVDKETEGGGVWKFELPDELGDCMPGLRVLDLSGSSSLARIPVSVASIVGLEVLVLAGCSNLQRLPDRLGGAMDQKGLEDAAAAYEAEVAAEAAAAAEAGEEPPSPPARSPSKAVPGLKLERLDLSGCAMLYMLPDLSHLEGIVVDLQGCREDLMIGWEKGMRKAFSCP